MKKINVLAAILVISGCQENLTRTDFIKESSGDAINSATTMQTIDPWQRYVYDTDLETSSQRQSIARAKYENGGKLPKKDPVGQPIYPFPFPVAPDGAPQIPSAPDS